MLDFYLLCSRGLRQRPMWKRTVLVCLYIYWNQSTRRRKGRLGFGRGSFRRTAPSGVVARLEMKSVDTSPVDRTIRCLHSSVGYQLVGSCFRLQEARGTTNGVERLAHPKTSARSTSMIGFLAVSLDQSLLLIRWKSRCYWSEPFEACNQDRRIEPTGRERSNADTAIRSRRFGLEEQKSRIKKATVLFWSWQLMASPSQEGYANSFCGRG